MLKRLINLAQRMTLDVFTYDLADERIAQRPVMPYDSAKLLLIKRDTGEMQSLVFSDFASLLGPQDMIVFNDTRVIPARFFGSIGPQANVEVFLLEELGELRWRCIGRPMRKMKAGTTISFGDGLHARVLNKTSAAELELSFALESDGTSCQQENSSKVIEAMHRKGQMPIPPYIRKGQSDSADKVDYQTIFAKIDGSIAAPTASLHFTPALMQRIETSGCKVRFATLHVGASSIRPLWRENEMASLSTAKPGAERYVYNAELLKEIRQVKSNGGRLIAVGTTVVRALESMVRLEEKGDSSGLHEQTDLFITPGFEFKIVDVLVTNFHQPATTHLLLVEAFMKKREILAASYEYALKNEYRFLSYGDGMCVL